MKNIHVNDFRQSFFFGMKIRRQGILKNYLLNSLPKSSITMIKQNTDLRLGQPGNFN